MRLPRVRISIGTLVFLVAVAAANCWIFRFLDPSIDPGFGAFVGRPDEPEILLAVLPLFNAALIGAILFVIRKLSSFVRRRTEPVRSPSGFSYFAFHLFAIGGVSYFLMPSLIETYLDALSPVSDYAEKAWSRLVPNQDDYDFNVRRVFEILTLGVYLSGPPLLLALIGGGLARRCAARLPRSRFRVLAGAVSLGFAGVAFAIAVTFQPFSEDRDIPLDFRIVDGDTARPVPAAFVCIRDAFDPDPPLQKAITGPDGHAPLNARFWADGDRSVFRTIGAFSPWGRWLEVSAPGYQSLRVPLTKVLGVLADLEGTRVQEVALTKGATPVGPFRDIAGTYERVRGMAGGRFVIEPDGRFSWHAWGGCSRSHVAEFGYLERADGEIRFVAIPRHDKEVHPLMTQAHRIVAWGEQHYLVEGGEDLWRLCRLGLNSNPSEKVDFGYWAYLRDSDREKPRAGLPQLPAKVWGRFLGYELDPRSEGGSLRLALKSLVPRNLRAESFQVQQPLILGLTQ